MTTTVRRRIVAVFVPVLMIIVSLACLQEVWASPKDTYKDGEPTAKVGVQLKVVDDEGKGVSGVTLTADYDGKKIQIGPSDENGIAKSADDAFQLYYIDRYVFNPKPPADTAVINKHAFKTPFSIEVTGWPYNYDKPEFRIENYPQVYNYNTAFSNYLIWSALGHDAEATAKLKEIYPPEPDTDWWSLILNKEWDGVVNGIYDISFNGIAYPLFGSRGHGIELMIKSGYKWQLEKNDGASLSNQSEDIDDGSISQNTFFLIRNTDKNEGDYGYGGFTLVTKKKPEFEVEFSKVETGKTAELPGAEFKITSTSIEGFDPITWTSTSETKKIKLLAGDYVLTETKAPNGYKVADPVNFTVTDEGKVTIGGTEQSGNKAVVEDEKKTPKLSIKKTSNVQSARPGDVIPFVITITNSGEGDASGVNVLDTMGDDLVYVSDDTGGSANGQTVEWTVDVPAGNTVTINIKCRIKESAAGKVVNNVEITNVESEEIVPNGKSDEFTIVLSEQSEPTKQTVQADEDEDDNEKNDRSSKTGDEAMIALMLLLMIAAGTIAFDKIKRRRA